MVKKNYRVCAVTVTYADRWGFLKQVTERLLTFDNVSHVVIVNNASLYNVKDEAAKLNDNRVIVLDKAENLGSTGGYKAGIAYAQQCDTDFVWLLDDDNLPSENSLDVLLNTWDELGTANNKTAFFSLRTDRIHHIHIAKGESPYRYYLVPDNFLNFTFLRPYIKLLKFADKFKKYKKYKERVTIPFASYGGFFLHKEMVDTIGYPDEKFYLYFDDAEYTYRVTQNGGTIWLIPGSTITDIDHSYQVSYKRKFLHSIHLDLWNFRTFYLIRNGIYFYKLNASERPLIFNINKFLFMTWLKLLSIAGAKQNEYKKLSAAVHDGLAGNLGKADPAKF
jgi:GT2 family glycosyltransferase